METDGIGDRRSSSVTELVDRMNSDSLESAISLSQGGEQSSLWKICVQPVKVFVSEYFYSGKVMGGRSGFVNAVIAGFSTFLQYAKLWELERTALKTRADREM